MIKFQGVPVSLVGDEVNVGDVAPDFQVLDKNLLPLSLSAFKGRTVLISAVPSLDTPVCEIETVKFNNMAKTLSSDIVILTISMDLPFAQTRWCQAKGVDHAVTVSDYRDASFGMAYGVLIDELRLLSRAVFLVDKEGIIRYTQIVPEITNEPDYEEITEALKSLS